MDQLLYLKYMCLYQLQSLNFRADLSHYYNMLHVEKVIHYQVHQLKIIIKSRRTKKKKTEKSKLQIFLHKKNLTEQILKNVFIQLPKLLLKLVIYS